MRNILIAAILAGLLAPALAQEHEFEIEKTIEGEPVYRLLTLNEIPSIDNPEWLSGRAADAQMKDAEPVIGVVVDGEAHAYSLWQLDDHEIVNDQVAGTAFAATW